MLEVVLVILVAVVAWVIVPALIRKHVNKKLGDAIVKIPHEYDKREGKFFYDFMMTFWQYRILQRKLVINMRYRVAELVEHEPAPEDPEYYSEEQPTTLPDTLHYNTYRELKTANPTLRKEQQAPREEYWVNIPASDLMAGGYLPVSGMARHDSLLWFNVPVYLDVTGAYKFEVPRDLDPKTGRPVYPQHTPAILDNMFKSQATREYIKGMTKTAMAKMDGQALLMLVILVIGAIGGLFLLGII